MLHGSFGVSKLKGGCTGSSESTLVKMPHCWKSHVTAQISFTSSFTLCRPETPKTDTLANCEDPCFPVSRCRNGVLWDWVTYLFCLFDLILNVPVNNFLVMSGQVFLGWTSTKQGQMCLAQGHNTVTVTRLEPATSQSPVKHSTTEPVTALP